MISPLPITLGKRVTLLMPAPGANTGDWLPIVSPLKRQGKHKIASIDGLYPAMSLEKTIVQIQASLARIFPNKGELPFNTDYGIGIGARQQWLLNHDIGWGYAWDMLGLAIASQTIKPCLIPVPSAGFNCMRPTEIALTVQELIRITTGDTPLLIYSLRDQVWAELNLLLTPLSLLEETTTQDKATLEGIFAQEVDKELWLNPGDVACYAYDQTTDSYVDLIDPETGLIDPKDYEYELLANRFDRMYRAS